MGPLEKEISIRIKSAFSPSHMELVNESSHHREHDFAKEHESNESHFRLVIVADAFKGLSRVQRQQKVYGVLMDLMKSKVHALSLFTYAPGEARPEY